MFLTYGSCDQCIYYHIYNCIILLSQLPITINASDNNAHLDMMRTEEKLTIEIRLLDEVVVGNGQSTSHSHPKQSKILQQLTTNSSTTNLKMFMYTSGKIYITKWVLNRITLTQSILMYMVLNMVLSVHDTEYGSIKL